MTTTAKLSGLVLATAFGMAIGHQLPRTPSPDGSGTTPAPARSDPRSPQQLATNSPDHVEPSKVVAKRIRSEYRLANCDVAEFPKLAETEIGKGKLPAPFWHLLITWNTRHQDSLVEWLRSRPDGVPTGAIGNVTTPLQLNLVSMLGRTGTRHAT